MQSDSMRNQVTVLFFSFHIIFTWFRFPCLQINMIMLFHTVRPLPWTCSVTLCGVEGCNGGSLHYMKIFSPECAGTKVQEAGCVFPGLSKAENTHPGGKRLYSSKSKCISNFLELFLRFIKGNVLLLLLSCERKYNSLSEREQQQQHVVD